MHKYLNKTLKSFCFFLMLAVAGSGQAATFREDIQRALQEAQEQLLKARAQFEAEAKSAQTMAAQIFATYRQRAEGAVESVKNKAASAIESTVTRVKGAAAATRTRGTEIASAAAAKATAAGQVLSESGARLPSRLYLSPGDWIYIEGQSFPSIVHAVDYENLRFTVMNLATEAKTGGGGQPEVLTEASLSKVAISQGPGAIPQALELAIIGNWVSYFPQTGGVPEAAAMGIIVGVYPNGDYAVRAMPQGTVSRVANKYVQKQIRKEFTVSNDHYEVRVGGEVITEDGRLAIVTEIKNVGSSTVARLTNAGERSSVTLLVGPSVMKDSVSATQTEFTERRILNETVTISGLFVPGCIRADDNCSGDRIKVSGSSMEGTVWAANLFGQVLYRESIFSAGLLKADKTQFNRLSRARVAPLCQDPVITGSTALGRELLEQATQAVQSGTAAVQKTAEKVKTAGQEAVRRAGEFGNSVKTSTQAAVNNARITTRQTFDQIRTKFQGPLRR
jgi:hypothetical protein